ncbi:MAG TPA: acyl-CoA dehydrogenase family protein [Acidimicrobiales bacterium]|nr:acyl-CoA dehydrogenase family protein [Acidimicrobiales bacterium]
MIQTSAVATDYRLLPSSLRSAIEDGREEADAERRLPADLAETLRAAGAFRITTPVEYGGAELSLTEAAEVYEAFGRIDGPVAWNIWNGSLGFAAALLPEEGASMIWSDADPIVANSARPAGVATPVPGGYRLSGRWDIVSAIDIADWVGLFAIAAGDTPEIRVLALPQRDITILDTWHTTGMRGTGSKTVLVDDVFVPEVLTTTPFSPARIDRPLYRVPGFTIASSGAASIVLGMAQAAIDEIVEMAPTKGTDNGQPLALRAHAHARLGEAQTALDAARALLRSASASIDAAAQAREPITELLRARARAAISHAAAVSREVLQTCYLLSSSTGVYTQNTIERLFRDGNVATQHFVLSPTHMEILGRLMVGQEAGVHLI